MKKVLSAILSVAMVASIGTTAFAECVGGTEAGFGFALTGDSVSEYADSGIGTIEVASGTDNLDSIREQLTDDKGANPYYDNDGGWTVIPDQKVYLPLSAFTYEYADNTIASVVEGYVRGETGDATHPWILPDVMDDADQWKLKVKKNSGSKMISSVTLVDKKFGSKRHAYIEVKLNDNYTNDDNKIDLDLTISNNSKKTWLLDASGNVLKPSNGIKAKLVFWVKNAVDEADVDYLAGVHGVVVNPTTDDENEIIWSDENTDLARLTFDGDSDVNKFFPKLSTVWDNSDYAAFFNDQDAFMFDFVANPYISTTSRALLEIYNPFLDSDDNATADPQSIVIYQVVDGDVIDVTKNFAFTTNEDGDEVFQTKTRQLGTYIFAEKAIQIAAQEPVAPEEPEEPAVDGGEKPIPNTGRW